MLQINVKSYKGVVQLSGFVDSAQSIKKAGEVAGSVTGVIEVKNDLGVK
jgi:osmotically-inducible protein OsmY